MNELYTSLGLTGDPFSQIGPGVPTGSMNLQMAMAMI